MSASLVGSGDVYKRQLLGRDRDSFSLGALIASKDQLGCYQTKNEEKAKN